MRQKFILFATGYAFVLWLLYVIQTAGLLLHIDPFFEDSKFRVFIDSVLFWLSMFSAVILGILNPEPFSLKQYETDVKTKNYGVVFYLTPLLLNFLIYKSLSLKLLTGNIAIFYSCILVACLLLEMYLLYKWTEQHPQAETV